MPGRKVIVHNEKESHEAFTTHQCRHCLAGVVCSADIGHRPEKCDYQPEYTCPECETKILSGSFKFGKRFDDCFDSCDWDDRIPVFKHDRKCSHNFEQIFRNVFKSLKGNKDG